MIGDVGRLQSTTIPGELASMGNCCCWSGVLVASNEPAAEFSGGTAAVVML